MRTLSGVDGKPHIFLHFFSTYLTFLCTSSYYTGVTLCLLKGSLHIEQNSMLRMDEWPSNNRQWPGKLRLDLAGIVFNRLLAIGPQQAIYRQLLPGRKTAEI